MQTSTSITKIAPALLEAQRQIEDAIKDSLNPYFKSKYANINAVMEACKPSLNKNGISILQPLVTENGKNYVRTVLLHESGEFISSDTEIVVAKEKDPQALGSAISYSRRYGLQSFVAVLSSEDDDAEKAVNRPTQTSFTKGNQEGLVDDFAPKPFRKQKGEGL